MKAQWGFLIGHNGTTGKSKGVIKLINRVDLRKQLFVGFIGDGCMKI